jgi:hypothetical protein
MFHAIFMQKVDKKVFLNDFFSKLQPVCCIVYHSRPNLNLECSIIQDLLLYM